MTAGRHANPDGERAPRRLRTHADAYGVHLEVTVELAPNVTVQELDRALTLLANQVRAQHADRAAAPC